MFDWVLNTSLDVYEIFFKKNGFIHRREPLTSEWVFLWNIRILSLKINYPILKSFFTRLLNWFFRTLLFRVTCNVHDMYTYVNMILNKAFDNSKPCRMARDHPHNVPSVGCHSWGRLLEMGTLSVKVYWYSEITEMTNNRSYALNQGNVFFLSLIGISFRFF